MNAILKGIANAISQWERRGTRRRRRESDEDSYDSIPVVTTNSSFQNVNTSPDVEALRFNNEREENEYLGLLYGLSKTWAWAALAHRCHTHPHEASTEKVNKEGDTALHWAVFGNPPLYAVQALIEACPEMVNIANTRGQIPLHMACCYRASTEVIHALLEANPKTATVRDLSGFYPLHLLCDYGCRVDTLEVFMQYEEAAWTVLKKDRIFGRTPLYILNQKKDLGMFRHHINELRKHRQRERDWVDGHNYDTLTESTAEAKSCFFWQKARLLILAEYCFSNALPFEDYKRDYFDCTIRACLGIDECPPSLLEYALLVYDEELLIPDEHGDLPLHQVCSNSMEFGFNRWLVLEVLSAKPEAARIPNRNGKFPLEIYLDTKLKICLEFPGWAEALKQLILANPIALDALQIDSRLYPRVIAKIGCNRETKSQIFDMLRGIPVIFSTSDQLR